LPELKAELQQIQQELETIELNLESSLFSWGSLKAPFWRKFEGSFLAGCEVWGIGNYYWLGVKVFCGVGG